MADWCDFLNFQPADDGCNSASNSNTCAPAGTCSNTGKCGGGSGADAEPVIGASTKIKNLLGESVMGKDGDVAVSSLIGADKVLGNIIIE